MPRAAWPLQPAAQTELSVSHSAASSPSMISPYGKVRPLRLRGNSLGNRKAAQRACMKTLQGRPHMMSLGT